MTDGPTKQTCDLCHRAGRNRAADLALNSLVGFLMVCGEHVEQGEAELERRIQLERWIRESKESA